VNTIHRLRILIFVLCLVVGLKAAEAQPSSGLRVFNVKDYGATGRKADNAQAAIQKAVDACAAAGGGLVYVPPGDYSSGTIHLRSHVRLFVEAGATVYSIHDKALFDKDALLYGEDLVNITKIGRAHV
jgi:polygalacturonase